MATTENVKNNIWDEKELGCLWRREKSSTKEKYLTGVLNAKKLRALLDKSDEDIQLVCFTNKNKSKDTHPDLRIYLSEKRPTSDGPRAAAPAAATQATRPAARPTQSAPPPDANDLI